MPDVTQLLTQRRRLLDEANGIQAKADLASRDLTPGEVQTIEHHLGECAGIVSQVDFIRGNPANKKDYSTLGAANGWERESQPQKTKIRQPEGNFFHPTSSPFVQPTPFGNPGESVADRMFGPKRDTGGFSSFGDWLQTVDSGRFDQRLRAANTIGSDSGGGFLVPEIYQNMFLDAVIERTVIASRCRRFPMVSDKLSLNGFDGNDHSSNLFGGLEAAWEQELPTLTAQNPTARRITFNARKLMILTQASNELVSDAPAYETLLGEALIQSTAWQLDYALLRGDGAGKPLGCTVADSGIEVAAEGSQTASTIWYDNLLKMFSRLHPASYATAIWVCNPSCLPQLFTLDPHESATALGSALVGETAYKPFIPYAV
jgi:hypothetical protein